MTVTIELPDAIAADLQGKWGDIPRHILRTITVDAFRRGELTGEQVMEMLGLTAQGELDVLLLGTSILPRAETKELTYATVNFDDPDQRRRFQDQRLAKARERIQRAVREMQDEGILDAEGRRIRKDLPPDMRPDSKATFSH